MYTLRMFTAKFFITSQNLEAQMSISIRINQLWHSLLTEYYTVIKTKHLMILATKWMTTTDIILMHLYEV